MDIEAFCDDDFNAVEWINKTYENAEQDNKEVFVSSLVAKLQLYVQNVNSALEDTSQQVLAGMPRTVKDIQNLRSEALSLQSKMAEVHTEISQVQRETGTCMANLERLDNLKTKLQTAKQGLQESDGWGRLTSELEDLLERNDVLSACDKLRVLQKSLAAQIGLPGQSEREIQVEDAKNKLEALASPSVVQCFTAGDLDQSKKYVEMFTKMERLPQLKQYYRTVQKTNIQRQWAEMIELAETSNSFRFLREFYEVLIENWQKQFKWCSQVFGTQGVIESILVITDLLGNLLPTRETVITNALKRSNEKLDMIAEFSNANMFFGNQIQKHLQSNSVKIGRDNLIDLSKSIYDYFNVFIVQYAAIEQNFLASNLVTLNLNQTNSADSIRILGSSNDKVMQWAEQALQRCESITQNCAIGALVFVLNSYFRDYMEKYKKVQKQLNANRGSEEDWNLLRTCTTLLQYLGDIIINMEEFERKVVTIVSATYDKVCRQDSSSFQYKVLRKQDINDLKKLTNSIKDNQTLTKSSGNGFILFNSVLELIKPICSDVHDTTLASVFAPIENHLKNIEPPQSLNASGSDLPDYSYSPNEYITQVGQYLMTLPQHLEPFLLKPSTALKTALEVSDEKYSRNIPSGDILLSLIAEECCALYQDQIYQICNIGSSSAKQLATDIEYLGSVLEELGLSLGTHLQQTAILLKASPEKYLSLSAGFDPKLVTAIRQMRNIISTE